jgi:serine/threonine protein kinase
MWLRNDEEFTSDMIGDYVGFVYIITDLTNNKKYVGKKLFESKRTLPPLKGKTRKRKVTKESDWMTYYGSSEELMSLVEANGGESFKREILHLCQSRGEMSYLEAKEQFDRGVLLSDDYYNGIINLKCHRTHVKGLRKKLQL